MNGKDRNIDILKHINRYCVEIFETQRRFGDSFNIFKGDFVYKNAVTMCILQIGELSGYLSDDFKNKHDGVSWRNIKGMRNVVAHNYGSLDAQIVWETIKEDIPLLYDYCNSILENYKI